MAFSKNHRAMIKRLLLLSVMMSAVGVPYMLSASSAWWTAFKSRFYSSSSSADGQLSGSAPQGYSSSFGGAQLASSGGQAPVEGYGRYQLSEVLQFDATPAWVMSRWPRVTSGLAEPKLQGYRVALVTGTTENDLAGSLTYYFDVDQRVKLIHFRGTTGNPRQLVAFVMSRYGFEPQASGDPALHLFQVKWNGKPTSELRIRPAQILKASQPYSRFEVELAMKRP